MERVEVIPDVFVTNRLHLEISNITIAPPVAGMDLLISREHLHSTNARRVAAQARSILEKTVPGLATTVMVQGLYKAN